MSPLIRRPRSIPRVKDPQWICRVVKVETRNAAVNHDVHEIFSKCGEILETRPYKSAKPDERHWFLEFRQQEGVDRARKLGLRDVQVFTLAGSSRLVEQYHSLIQPPCPMDSGPDLVVLPPLRFESKRTDKSPATALQGKPHPHHLGSFVLHEPHKHSGPGDANGGASAPEICSPLSIPVQLPPSPTTTPCGPLLGQLKSCNLSISTRCTSSNGVDTAGTPLDTLSTSPLPPSPLLISTSLPSIPVPHQLPTPVSPTRPLPAVSSLAFSLETRIVMSLCGESIVYDLQTMEDDPRAIIDLLKVTASERGNWIHVACHYRRKGNVNAAIVVVTTMLEVMAENGIPEHELKPAFLLLSSCETELAKRATRSNSSLSAEHTNNSKRWLQKVYGVNTSPSSSTVAANALGLDLAAGDAVASAQNRNSGSAKAKMTPNAPRHKVSAEGRRSAALNPIVTDTTSPNLSHIQVLEREIQSLRDRHAAQSILLSDTLSGKRKLEDELVSERTVRRKLERAVEDVERDLQMSKKMEDFALQQVKKEVDARRKTEAKVEVEREKRKEAEKALETRAVKPLLEDLANMFQRAAQGEGNVLVGLKAGGSRGSGKRT